MEELACIYRNCGLACGLTFGFVSRDTISFIFFHEAFPHEGRNRSLKKIVGSSISRGTMSRRNDNAKKGKKEERII